MLSMAIDVPTILNSILVVAGAVGLTASPFVVKYAKTLKAKLHAFRVFVDELDEDVKDNHLTNEEYAALVKDMKDVASA